MNNDKKIELFTRAGEAAYGSNWKSELARVFGINDRSVRQWVSEERRLPASMVRAMVSHLRDRAYLMHREADRLIREMKFDTDPDFKDMKVLFLEGRLPLQERLGSDAHDFLCFDVNGFIYCINKSDRVVDLHGNDTELKGASILDLRDAFFKYVNDPKNQVD
ncbi:hypothetical protein [Erwinia sp. 9145]|uniref:hypothetical protein n=1 Tax=Erwinia sp. 9145 TaxID=1500895 RepID=UPI0006909C87|nr:hypothetical protein [Erwinia sp. 9145]